MRKKQSVLGLALAVFAAACADPTGLGRTLVPESGSLAVTVNPPSGPLPLTPVGTPPGNVRVCKDTPAGDPSQNWTFTVSVQSEVDAVPLNPPTPPAASVTIAGIAGGLPECADVFVSTKAGAELDRVTITEQAAPQFWTLTDITIDRYRGGLNYNPSPAFPLDAGNTGTGVATLYINSDMARVVTFRNDYEAPPVVDPICDFVTFGRLVTEVGGNRVVISGNVGGVNANATIKNEFHVEVNGVDYHVANAFTYGPILSGPLSGPSFPNSRMATGNAKNGVAVELRVWDGGEPGKGTDWVYIKIGTPGTEWLGANGRTINQGNMQYHPNCRGPG